MYWWGVLVGGLGVREVSTRRCACAKAACAVSPEELRSGVDYGTFFPVSLSLAMLTDVFRVLVLQTVAEVVVVDGGRAGGVGQGGKRKQ